jgi:hypothetical protein
VQAKRPQISHIAPRLRPQRLALAPRTAGVIGATTLLRGSVLTPTASNLAASNLAASRLVPRLLVSRLLGQLVPAALVASVGVLALSNLAKAPNTGSNTAPVATAISAEAVFKIAPRELQVADQVQDAQPQKASRAAVKPKPLAANTHALRPVVNEPPRQVVSAPLSIAPSVPAPSVPQPQAVVATPSSENGVMSTLRGATAAVRRIPQWATSSMAGWLPEGAPPRPPAPIPMVDFQASM